MKKLALATVALLACVLMFATRDFPAWGDPESPASRYVSPHYLSKAVEETATPNVVTAVLGDYRGYDTMFETAVIFTAGMACFFLLRRKGGKTPPVRYYRHRDSGMVIEVKTDSKQGPNPRHFMEIDARWTPYDPVVRTVGKILIPFIQLFGLYVIAHGHHSPGGGFQGGVILGASVILLAITDDLRTAVGRLEEKASSLLSVGGIFFYAGVGLLCLWLGGNFLDYEKLGPLLGVASAPARSWGIFLVEVGVGMAVMATVILIYKNLASEGRMDQGL